MLFHYKIAKLINALHLHVFMLDSIFLNLNEDSFRVVWFE